MTALKSVLAAAVLAFAGAVALTGAASADRYGGYGYGYGYGHGHHRGWNGPEGYFLVYARACPDLREDRRDRRYNRGWRDRREDRRDRRVLECPPRAWQYVPSHYERRMGRYGDRLRPTVAYRAGRHGYVVETRWGPVPVRVVWSRRGGFHDGHRWRRSHH